MRSGFNKVSLQLFLQREMQLPRETVNRNQYVKVMRVDCFQRSLKLILKLSCTANGILLYSPWSTYASAANNLLGAIRKCMRVHSFKLHRACNSICCADGAWSMHNERANVHIKRHFSHKLSPFSQHWLWVAIWSSRCINIYYLPTDCKRRLFFKSP